MWGFYQRDITHTDPVFFMDQKLIQQYEVLQLLTTNKCNCKSQFSQYPLVTYCVDHSSSSSSGVLIKADQTPKCFTQCNSWWHVSHSIKQAPSPLLCSSIFSAWTVIAPILLFHCLFPGSTGIQPNPSSFSLMQILIPLRLRKNKKKPTQTTHTSHLLRSQRNSLLFFPQSMEKKSSCTIRIYRTNWLVNE